MRQTITQPESQEHDVNQLAGTGGEAATAKIKLPPDDQPEGEQLSMLAKVRCGAPNDGGPKLNFEVDLTDNPEQSAWHLMREIANGRLKCTIRPVAQDGMTGSLIDQQFNATGDAGKVGYNAAQRTVTFGISFRNGDEGKHAALDLHNRNCTLVLMREGDAREESPNAHFDQDEQEESEVDRKQLSLTATG